jgi:transposase
VAIVAGNKAEIVIEQISKIDRQKRQLVKEITLEMANSMKLISKKCFSRVIQVTDRFHVQKLALRIKHRWEAMDFENQLTTQAKEEDKT